jgi:hypothetical protein
MTACNRHLNLQFTMFIELYLYSIKFSNVPTNALRFMNVILLKSNHRHGLATHVAIIRVMSTKTQM